jgi:hypothetical protein
VKYRILGISNNVYEEFEDNKGGESVNQRRPVNTMGKKSAKGQTTIYK